MDSESKTYVFQPEGGSLLPMVTAMMQNRGVDPGIIAMLNNNKGCLGGDNLLALIILFAVFGYGGNGLFGGGGGNAATALNNDANTNLIMQTLNRNGLDINTIAQNMNCNVNALTQGINSLGLQLANVANQTGMSAQGIINAIQAGNADMCSRFAQCCCDNKLLVTQLGYENQIATLQQTNNLDARIDLSTKELASAIQNQTTMINDRFCQLETRELQNKINNLQEVNSTLVGKISNAEQTREIQNYVSSLINPLVSEVNAIKAAQPATTTVQYPNLTAIPTSQLLGYGYGINQGIW